MPTNHQMFADVCNHRLKNDWIASIEVSYENEPGESPCIKADLRPGPDNEIHDEKMNVENWRRFGKAAKTKKFSDLKLNISEDSQDREVTPKAAQCLQAFFEELKDNMSISSIYLDIDLCAAISPLDLRHFLQNNKKMHSVDILSSSPPISPSLSMNVATALKDLNIRRVDFHCEFLDKRSCQQILSACQSVRSLSLNCDNYDHCMALAEYLGNPNTKLQDLYINMNRETRERVDFVSERAVSIIFAGVTQNVQLKTLVLDKTLLHWEGSGEYLDNLLCNTTSLQSVCQSNHSLESIELFPWGYRLSNMTKDTGCWSRCSRLNQLEDKRKVVQIKIMLFYFGQKFSASSLANMPLVVIPEILGIDLSERKEFSIEKKKDNILECSAVFNIVKTIPELCDVSSRAAAQSEKSSYIHGAEMNKRQKLGM